MNRVMQMLAIALLRSGAPSFIIKTNIKTRAVIRNPSDIDDGDIDDDDSQDKKSI